MKKINYAFCLWQFSSITQARSTLWQVAHALAVGEKALQFEHRDLHWGNVLVKPNDHDSANFIIDGSPISVPSHGVKVTVIDYTLSRLSKGGCNRTTFLIIEIIL